MSRLSLNSSFSFAPDSSFEIPSVLLPPNPHRRHNAHPLIPPDIRTPPSRHTRSRASGLALDPFPLDPTSDLGLHLGTRPGAGMGAGTGVPASIGAGRDARHPSSSRHPFDMSFDAPLPSLSGPSRRPRLSSGPSATATPAPVSAAGAGAYDANDSYGSIVSMSSQLSPAQHDRARRAGYSGLHGMSPGSKLDFGYGKARPTAGASNGVRRGGGRGRKSSMMFSFTHADDTDAYAFDATTDAGDERGEGSPGGAGSTEEHTDPRGDTSGSGKTQNGLNMVQMMQLWRHDALSQHLYETAAFWGDKVLSLTAHPDDAFWLAQVYFLQGHYVRAERVLMMPLPRRARPDPTGASSGLGNRKGKGRAVPDDAAGHSGLDSPPGLSGGEEGEETGMEGRRPVNENLACRYLAANALYHQEKHQEALELLGESNPFSLADDPGKSEMDEDREGDVGEEDGSVGEGGGGANTGREGIKLHSSMCFLRGLIHLRLGAMDYAKENLMEALVIDVKNYDAFKELVEGKMMQPDEEWTFFTSLAYRQVSEEASMFVRLLYLTKLNKDAHGAEIQSARKELAAKYDLSDNTDVLVALADELYAAYKWEDCHVVTTRILARVPNHPAALTLHIACMHHINRHRSALYLLAQELVDQDPLSAVTWYAAGMWYFTGKRWGEARRYFSKATLHDPRYAAAWIAFAHSFAYEGEHDQAITAYATCTRLFKGSHLPLLFIGMEHLHLSAINLAGEYLLAAQAKYDGDPLLMNELGVVAYNKEDYNGAIKMYKAAIRKAKGMQGESRIWSATHCNLGHAYRLTGDLDRAEISYLHAVRLDPTNHTALASIAMISHLRTDVRGAVRLYHAALALSPQDAIITVLLEMALKDAGTMDVTTLPGLPAELRAGAYDPHRLVRRVIAGASTAGTAAPASGSAFLSAGGMGEVGEEGYLDNGEREDSVRMTRGRGSGSGRYQAGRERNGAGSRSGSGSSSPKKGGTRAGTEERRMTRSMSRGVELEPTVEEGSMEEDMTMDMTMEMED